MATDIGFQIKLTPNDGSQVDLNEIVVICEQAKLDCNLEGLHGKYWFNVKQKSDHISVELFGYYTGGENDPNEALENVLEMTWQDEDNGPLIVKKYFQQLSQRYDIAVVRDYWTS